MLADVALSDLEKGFLKLLAEHGLPVPRTNIDHDTATRSTATGRPSA